MIKTTRKLIVVAALTCAATGLTGQALAAPVPVESPRWLLEGETSKVVDYQGKHALYLKAAIARLADAKFDTGVIEFDMLMPDAGQSFPGILFRGQDDGNYEDFYLRPHQNGRPDANQYTPVINGLTGWQIYSGTNYETQMTYRLGQWFHVKLEIAEDSARIYVDSDTPTLVVHDLKREEKPGFIVMKGSQGGAYFANVEITASHPAAALAEPAADLPPGLIKTWSVSPPMKEADAFAAARTNRLKPIAWKALPVETNGIANLARVGERSDETPTILARLSVAADHARTVPLRFGFSDKVQVYLNGVPIYRGDDAQYTRDYRFLGTVGLYDTLLLPLRAGQNDIGLAITEGGGGWAAMAAFPEAAGLTIKG